MAWLNRPLRRMMVAAALLVLCVVQASCVLGVASTAYTAAQQTNTLKFLQGIAAANPSLAAVWTGTNFCTWNYISCTTTSSASLSFAKSGSPTYTGTLTLPEMAADIDATAVIFTEIIARAMGSRFTRTLPSSWGALRTLEVLRMDMNALSGGLPQSWASLGELKVIDLSFNQLTGSLPESWAALHKLVAVSLQFNALIGELPSAWASWHFVELLELQGNLLSGGLPETWADMSSVQLLFLSMNVLEGPLPSVWGAQLSSSLQFLHLVDNAFCGCVPATWTNVGAGWAVDEALLAEDCATANACTDTQVKMIVNASERVTLGIVILGLLLLFGMLRVAWCCFCYGEFSALKSTRSENELANLL